MLKIEHVSKTFNLGTINEKKALIDINLQLDDGDFVTVIGGNGAGKSTLMNMIAGVYPIDCGHIKLDDKDISLYPEYKRAGLIGRVFQDPMMGTAADMQIDENLAMAKRRGHKRTLKWGIKKEEKKLYYDLLKTLNLGLEERMTSKVGLLSGGQRQALTLLMATVTKPKILLLDEHTAALDPATSAKVLLLTNKIVTEQKLTAMMVTHDMQQSSRLRASRCSWGPTPWARRTRSRPCSTSRADSPSAGRRRQSYSPPARPRRTSRPGSRGTGASWT